jgi:hypothetical protein
MSTGPQYDVFLSHAHENRDWVEAMAQRLEDERGIRVWLDRWRLVPGESWQQAMAKGMDEAATCAIFLGGDTPTGWFRQEIEHAVNLQSEQPEFRVIPVLLPDALADSGGVLPAFIDLRTWADFREGQDTEYAFHVLVQGIRGEPVGRWRRAAELSPAEASYAAAERRLKKLRDLNANEMIVNEVAIEFQQKILSRWLEEDS